MMKNVEPQSVDLSGDLSGIETAFARISATGRHLLAPIRGFASLIQDGSEEGTNEHRWAERIMRDTEWFEHYLERLNLLGVSDAAQMRECNWAGIIADALDHLRPLELGTTIEITNQSGGAFVHAPEVVSRAVFQVLRNACEAVGPRGSVEVFAGGPDENGGHHVVVCDDGPGIASDPLDQVWNPFYTTRNDHLGMGLTFVAAAARATGMGVDLATVAGRGTTVTLTLRKQGGNRGA